jgi:hypothetical protein
MNLAQRLCLLAAVFAAGTAHAAPEADGDEDRSYWTVTFMGSLLEPIGDMADSHDSGLATGLRIGWAGAHRFGFVFDARYSPIPHDQRAPLETIEAHFFHSAAAAAYAYRRGLFRVWAAGGGAAMFERVNTVDSMLQETTEHDWAAGGYGAAGIDFLLFSNGGPSVSGSYAHAVAGGDYTFYGGSAGVTFLF